ncbi:hypothetical protein FRC07_007004 [Ceratobasidium sp. 392]|nr:hypothetical protein FRC07_007004 [Ceratobasidium sp. 392]
MTDDTAARNVSTDNHNPQSHIVDEECPNPADSDYYLSEQERPELADSTTAETNQDPQVALDPISIRPAQDGVILPSVVNDAVWTSQSEDRAEIENVTRTTTYAVNKSSTSHLNSVATKFFQQENAILLLPETISLGRQGGTSADLCVIHVNWPSDEARYKKQLDLHRAPINILVACSGDSDMYPCGANILLETVSWPTEENPFRATDGTQLSFDEKLLEIPVSKKEHIYLDWITSHGPCGTRYVKAWDATTLVHRANLYLLDVLRYKGSEPTSADDGLQVSLPRVSPGFVAHNKLESAVDDGVLHVQLAPGSINTLSAPKDEVLPYGAVSLNENANSQPVKSIPTSSVQDHAPVHESTSSITNDNADTVSEPISANFPTDLTKDDRPASVDAAPVGEFVFIPQHSYIAIEEEFDAIPLICFLANAHSKLVCFLDDESALTHYRTLLGQIVSHAIYYPAIAKEPSAVEDAASNFMAQPVPSILLLSITTKKLPLALKNLPSGGIVHWGQHLPFRQASPATRHHRQISCSYTYIITTMTQRNGRLENGPIEFESHPNSEMLLSQNGNSMLAYMRNKTKSVLASNEKLVQSMYRSRAYWLARTPRRVMSAEKVAQNVNIYAARILLRGSIEDGNKTVKPIGGRPSVGAKFISKFELEPAVELGLLST